MQPRYIFFHLELALANSDDWHVYAFKNVSHIPTAKLIEIFNINLEKDPYILEGYFLTKSIYKKHKKYIDKNFGPINLDVFEYSLSQSVSYDANWLRGQYKESLME